MGNKIDFEKECDRQDRVRDTQVQDMINNNPGMKHFEFNSKYILGIIRSCEYFYS